MVRFTLIAWRISGGLLKRAVKGTYGSVEPFHLFRYLDEQSFRYNERHDKDAQRFQKGVKVGRRKAADLEYSKLSGGGVMSDTHAKAEEGKKTERPKKPPGYRKFEKLLKQAIKAPPMRKIRGEQDRDSTQPC